MSEYKLVDVHAHLSHKLFCDDIDALINSCRSQGVCVISNGTDYSSNRFCLDLSKKYKWVVFAALGIYPVEALYNMGVEVCSNYQIEKFCLEDEIHFIEDQARAKNIIAIGEIGLDGHSLDESTYQKQEEIFVRLSKIGIDNDLVLIVHSRKMESRCLKLLESLNAKKVIMHCYCGNVAEAVEYAKKYGWMFSLPVTTPTHSKLSVLAKRMDISNLLLETDSPYLSGIKGQRNTPLSIKQTLDYLCKIKNQTQDKIAENLFSNFIKTFGSVF